MEAFLAQAVTPSAASGVPLSKAPAAARAAAAEVPRANSGTWRPSTVAGVCSATAALLAAGRRKRRSPGGAKVVRNQTTDAKEVGAP